LRGLYYDGEFAALKGYKHVMDLGWFLGDSALFLAEHNTKVSTLEPCTDNYNLLWINTRNKDNIMTYHGAIVGQKNIDMTFAYIGWNYNMGWYIQPDPGGTIRSYDLISLYNQDPFDALKIDVEGGEYDILNDIQLLLETHPWYIRCIALEFHDLHKPENAQSYISYANMLTKCWFTHTITDQRSDTKLLYTPEEVVTKLDVILMHSVC
jgi:FkbM family methyltransferase